jgi:exosortase/archaeosortase family protein
MLVARRWLVFVAVVAALTFLDEWANRWTNVELSRLTAAVLAALLRLVGAEGRAHGTLVHSEPCTFEIIGECTAYYPAALFIAAVLAYPAGARARAAGLALGLPALAVINQARLVSLCFVAGRSPQRFETVHLVVWPSLLMTATVLLWVGWVALFTRHAKAALD